MRDFLKASPLILMEAAVVEQLRRMADVPLHETLVNAPLIYSASGRAALGRLYHDYIDIAQAACLPMLVCTPTWRANQQRVREAGVDPSINAAAVEFMCRLRDARGGDGSVVKIGGMFGCKNDCYKPDEGLPAEEAAQFHAWQVAQLARAGVDFLIAETMPSVQEALGAAHAMETTGVPYIVSFVISRHGRVLDGTSLGEAVERIDAHTQRRPLGYMVNCAYPSFLCPSRQPAALFDRLIGYVGNASSLDHGDLDGAAELQANDLSEWGDLMLRLNRTYGVQILGGCCGTGRDHLRYIVNG